MSTYSRNKRVFFNDRFFLGLRGVFFSALCAMSFIQTTYAQPIPVKSNALLSDRYTLDYLIEQTIQTHPLIASKRSDVLSAQAGVDSAQWQFFPSVSLSRQKVNGASAVSGVTVHGTTTAIVQQPIWTGGRLTGDLAVADANLYTAGVSILEAQYSLALRVVDNFQGWLTARGRVIALTGSLSQLKDYEGKVSRRVEGGVSAQSDKILVDARLAQTRSDLSAAIVAVKNALFQLEQLSGVRLSDDSLLSQELNNYTVDINEKIDQALARSPVLKRLEAEMNTAQHEIDVKRSALFPNVSFQIENIKSDSAPATVADKRVMFVLSYTPGAGLSALTNIDAAQSRSTSFAQNLEASRRDFITQVRLAHADYVSASSRRLDIVKNLEANQLVLASYDRLFVAGKRSWLDVLNAAREVTQSQLAVSDLKASLIAAQMRLRIYLGEVSWLQKDVL